MMLCYKQLSLFMFLLPFPTASPLIMLAFTALMIAKLRPCIYCVVLMIITYIGTCTTSFFDGTHPTAQPALAINFTSSSSPLQPFMDSHFRFAAPSNPRYWVDYNGGRMQWPVLDGYKLVEKRRVWRQGEREKVLEARKLKELSTATEEEVPTEQQSVEWTAEAFESTETEEEPPQVEQVVILTQGSPVENITQQQLDWERSYDTGGRTADVEMKKRHWSLFGKHLEEVPATPIDAANPQIPQSPQLDDDETPSASPPTRSFLGIPIKSRYDLRISGLGLVVDFSAGRTEQAIVQEVGEWIDWEDRAAARRWREEDEKIGLRPSVAEEKVKWWGLRRGKEQRSSAGRLQLTEL